MKTIFAILLITTIIIGGYLYFTEADKPKEPEPIALALIASNRKNLPKLQKVEKRILPSVYDACYSHGEISIFTAEGEPINRSNLRIINPLSHLSETTRSSTAMAKAMDITYECKATKASSEEIDTLKAITLGADFLQGSALADKRMTIYESGLCTAGILNMLSGDIFEKTPEEIVEFLREADSLPDLKGVRIEWIGLGAAAGKQEKIPDEYKEKLKALWEAIISASGGEVEFDMKPVRGWETRVVPEVSAIDFAE